MIGDAFEKLRVGDCLSPAVINWRDIEGAPVDEILEHVKAVRYNTDAEYAEEVDAKREAKRRAYYQKHVVNTDKWWKWCKEFMGQSMEWTVGMYLYDLLSPLDYREMQMVFPDKVQKKVSWESSSYGDTITVYDWKLYGLGCVYYTSYSQPRYKTHKEYCYNEFLNDIEEMEKWELHKQ